MRDFADNTGFAPEDAAWQAFSEAARAAGLDPHDRWVGGYADYEWEHLRVLLRAYEIAPEGQDVLEFGSNIGASSVVLARLGAQVTGVDINADFVDVANANFALNNVEHQARALHVTDTRRLPFEAGRFDFAIANSVLEYADPAHIPAIMREIHRVMAPGAPLLICGTSSRLAPREMHSGKWLVNYWPRVLDRLTGRARQRGLSPFLLAGATRELFRPVAQNNWLAARKALHGKASLPTRMVDTAARAIGIAPGWLSPSIEVLLQRL